MDVRAGTSGYSYKEWKGSFYPDDIAAAGMLEYYASRLPSVEINNTFYRLPRASVLEGWAAQVPETFRFAIKASRRITHMKRLKDAGDETAYLQETLGVLGDKLGVVLYQTPPNLKQDIDRLRAFIELLSPDIRSVFEFRHPTWFAEDTYALLRERGCALCAADVDDEPEAELVSTAPFGYLRLRRTAYSPEDLARWAGRIGEQAWDEAYVFFKHEDGATGPAMAEQMLEKCDEVTK